MPGDPGPLFASLPSRWTSDDLANLHRESTNLIQFTHPDPVLGDPEEELQRLYRERVQPRGAARGRGSPWTASRTAEVFRGVFARRHKTMAIDETGKIPLNDGTYNFDLTIRNGKPLFVVETVSFRLQNLTRVEHVAGWFAHVWPHVAAETSAEGILLAERDASSAEAESYYRRIERWAKEAKIAVKDAQNAQQLAEAIVEQVPSFGGGHQTTSF